MRESEKVHYLLALAVMAHEGDTEDCVMLLQDLIWNLTSS